MNRSQTNMAIFLDFLVSEIKEYAEKYEVKPVTAFEDVVSKYFYYSEGQKHLEINMKSYQDIFFKFISGESEIPEKYFKLIRRYYNYSHDTYELKVEPCKHDNDYRLIIVNAVKEKIERIENNEAETTEIRELLSKAAVWGSFITISPLIEWAENHNRLDNPFFCNLFTYGYILGKRAERAKRRGDKT